MTAAWTSHGRTRHRAETQCIGISYRLGDTWSPALAEFEAAGTHGDRVRQQHPASSLAATERRTRCGCFPSWRRQPQPHRRRCVGTSRNQRSTKMQMEGNLTMSTAPTARGYWSPAAPEPLARQSSTNCWRPGLSMSMSWTTWSAGAAPTSTARCTAAGTTHRGRSCAIADLVARTHPRTRTSSSTRRLMRITQCAEEPRLALEVLVDGTFNVLEAAADAGVRKLVAASSASVYGHGRGLPDRRIATTTTTTTRSTGRPRRSTRACSAASGPCTAWTTWLCATSTCTARAWTCTVCTPRCWCAGWNGLPTACRR